MRRASPNRPPKFPGAISRSRVASPFVRFEHGPDPRTPIPLPDGVRCFAVAATTGSSSSLDEPLPNDGIVPVESALGKHTDNAFALRFTDTRILPGLHHLDLLSHPSAYAALRDWLAPPR